MRPLTFVLLFAVGLGAQSTGEIRGYAWDADGRPVPGAKISLHADDAKADRTVTTGADGAFDARDLAPGHYGITADSSKRQIATETPTPLELKPGQIFHADITMGKSTVHYGYWKRLVRRLDGLH